MLYFLLNPNDSSIPNKAENKNIEEVEFFSEKDEIKLSGWFFSANTDKYLIISHGYGENRNNTKELALGLNEIGYNVLTFDFRNSGTSDNAITTIGQKEKFDLLGAINYLKEKESVDKLGLIGFSMGAATTALVIPETSQVNAVVLDSPFADLKSYLDRSLNKWTRLPDYPFNWLALRLGRLIYDLKPEEVSPIEEVQKSDTPILFIHGKEDNLISHHESLKLYKSSSNSQDKLWLLDGVDHVEAMKKDFKQYLKQIDGFFNHNF